MKSRLFAVIFSVFCFANLFAADLLSFCPDNSFGAGFIDFAALRKHPQLAELLKGDDVKSKLDELSSQLGCRVEEWNQGIVFAVENGKDNPVAGLVLDMPVLNDIPAVLNELKQNGEVVDYTEKTIAGQKSYVVTSKDSEDKIVLTPMAQGIVFCTQEVDSEAILSMKRGNPVALRKQIAELPEKNTAVWLTGDVSNLNDEGNIETYKIRSIFKFSADGKKYSLIGNLICPDEDTCATINMLVSMYSGVINGVVFNQDPALGKAVRKCLKLKSEQETFNFKFEITQDLVDKVVAHLKEHKLDTDQLGL